METVNVSGLKNNPSEALRKARQDVVVVLNRDRPDALMIGVELAGGLDAKGIKPAVLQDDGALGQLDVGAARTTRFHSAHAWAGARNHVDDRSGIAPGPGAPVIVTAPV